MSQEPRTYLDDICSTIDCRPPLAGRLTTDYLLVLSSEHLRLMKNILESRVTGTYHTLHNICTFFSSFFYRYRFKRQTSTVAVRSRRVTHGPGFTARRGRRSYTVYYFLSRMILKSIHTYSLIFSPLTDEHRRWRADTTQLVKPRRNPVRMKRSHLPKERD